MAFSAWLRFACFKVCGHILFDFSFAKEIIVNVIAAMLSNKFYFNLGLA